MGSLSFFSFFLICGYVIYCDTVYTGFVSFLIEIVSFHAFYIPTLHHFPCQVKSLYFKSYFIKQDKLLRNKPWVLEDETGHTLYQGDPELSAAYYLLMRKGNKEISAIPAGSWYVVY